MPARMIGCDGGPAPRGGLRACTAAGPILAGLLVVAGPVPGSGSPGRFPDAATGQQLILGKGCTNCHGILGPGGRQGPDLLRAARGKGAAEVLAAMWNHVPQMVQALLAGERLPSLSAEELRDLVGYLNFVNYLGDPGDAVRGGTELAQQECLACHDLAHRGKIGPALVDPLRSASPVGLVTAIWNHYPGMHDALLRRGLEWFAWSGDLVTDVSRYLRGFVPATTPAPLLAPGDPLQGANRFTQLGCAGCHDLERRGAGAAIARRSNRRSAAENGAALLRHLPSIERSAGRTPGARRPLSEAAMADLLAYLSLAGAELPGGDAARGRAVFARQRCGTCHALPGEKSGIGPDVRDMPSVADPYEVAALMLQHGRNMKTATELKHVPWPRMEADELVDLCAFLASEQRR